MLRRFVARVFWLLTPWKLVTEPAPGRPTVLIGAPHTSNWDFILMLASAWRLDMDVRWLGKKSLFRGWRGPIMRALGGISVDRSAPGKLVGDLAEQARSGEVFSLVIAPDGTRRGHTHWKSGFYHIAREADLPVTLAYIDRTTLSAGLGPSIDLTGNVAADMDRIRAFYADKAGFKPDHRIEPRLADESGVSA